MKNILTAKEIEIIKLVSKGLSNKEIASIQCVEEMTVKIHINHILSKLNLKRRAELIVHYFTSMLDDAENE